MLDYGWGNPSPVMLTGEDNPQDSDQGHHHIFEPYAAQNFPETTATFIHPDTHFAASAAVAGVGPFHQNAQFTPFYDPRAYGASAASYPHHPPVAAPPPPHMLSLEPAVPAGFLAVPKAEPGAGGFDFNAEYSSRIGLNLGGRTYFASSEDDFVNRLYRRSRIFEPGSASSARCQAEGCSADLSHAKHYHRRHKVCEFHSKAATVIAAGLTQRFCQQCSRFHQLPEFDNGKRSCRKRLADHNRRRRKSSQQTNNQESINKSQSADNNNAPNTSSENLASRSPPDSGQHSSSVTVAISPPRISLDYFGHRSNYAGVGPTTSSTASTGSLFYSN